MCFLLSSCRPPQPSLQALPSLSFAPSGLPPSSCSLFSCGVRHRFILPVMRVEQRSVSERGGTEDGGGQGQQGGRYVCTIRDKIMAPQGLVWPCTRSIKRWLQVPRSTLMSIFWGLILHAEHSHCQHTLTGTH